MIEILIEILKYILSIIILLSASVLIWGIFCWIIFCNADYNDNSIGRKEENEIYQVGFLDDPYYIHLRELDDNIYSNLSADDPCPICGELRNEKGDCLC